MNDEVALAQALEEVARRAEVARAPQLRPILDETANVERQRGEIRARSAELRRATARMPTKASTRVWWTLVPLLLLWAPAIGRDESGPWWAPPLLALGAAALGRLAGRFL